jgi:hypothetical protein
MSRRVPARARGDAGVGWLEPRQAFREQSVPTRPASSLAFPAAPGLAESATVKAARRLNRAAGMIAASVMVDSAMEHYRGDFHNKAMWTPLISSALSLAVSVHGHRDQRHGAHRGRDLVYAAAGLTGIVGTGFHLYNITKKPGGFSWQNVFYSAPIGAPAALSLSGLMGFLSERVRDNEPGTRPKIAGYSAGRAVAALTSASLLGTMGEAGLLHFRGAYHNPVMFIPVSVPPVAAALLANTAIGRSRVRRPVTRWWLRATTLMGLVGVAFHAYGVSRNMGGWRNWRQNAFNGPPLPAPPSFTGLAMAGLAALGLLEDHPDD